MIIFPLLNLNLLSSFFVFICTDRNYQKRRNTRSSLRSQPFTSYDVDLAKRIVRGAAYHKQGGEKDLYNPRLSENFMPPSILKSEKDHNNCPIKGRCEYFFFSLCQFRKSTFL